VFQVRITVRGYELDSLGRLNDLKTRKLVADAKERWAAITPEPATLGL
jgi:acyl-CoA thioester hydrolase